MLHFLCVLSVLVGNKNHSMIKVSRRERNIYYKTQRTQCSLRENLYRA